jgi:hypothetical protein
MASDNAAQPTHPNRRRRVGPRMARDAGTKGEHGKARQGEGKAKAGQGRAGQGRANGQGKGKGKRENNQHSAPPRPPISALHCITSR